MGWIREAILRWLASSNTLTTSQDLDTWMRFGSIQSTAGITVNVENAQGLAAFSGCVRTLSNDVAQLPLVLFRRNGNRREPARDLPLFTLLHDRPNEWQTSYQWRKLSMRDLLFRGNVYSLIGMGQLLRLHPDRMEVKQHPRTMVVTYEYTRGDGQTITFPREKILHIWSDSDDGKVGLNPLQAHRESLGDGIAVRQHGSKFFRNAARISGVLEVPAATKIGDPAGKAILHDFNQMYAGNEPAHATALLPGGIQFKPVSISMDDAQWIEARQQSGRDICGIMGVPTHKIGDKSDATFSNVEAENTSYVINGLMPWLVCWEQAINRDVLKNDPELYVKFNIAGLLRGNAKERAESLQIQRRNGIINANEWRELEERNAREDPGGDEYIVEKNMRIQDGEPIEEGAATPDGGTASFF